MKHRVINTAMAIAMLMAASSAMASSEFGSDVKLDSQVQIGEVSAQIVDGTINDATAEIAHKCDKLGASHFRIIDIDRPGDGGQIFAHAIAYK